MIVSCRPALPKDKSASRPVGPTNGSGFGETNPQAGIAQLTERRSRKAEAGGLPLLPAPCPHSSIGRASGLYLERCTFDSMLRAPIRRRSTVAVQALGKGEVGCSIHSGGTTRSWWNGRHNGLRSCRRKTMGVQVSPSAPIRPRSPIGRGPALNAGKCRFEACRGYALVAQLVEAAASRAACCRFESCAAHQLKLPSPSGKGIWPTPRHSAVRVRQGAPLNGL